jgi:hypothetical protein
VTQVQENIPKALEPHVDAAVQWFNQREDVAFKATGIINPEEARSANPEEARSANPEEAQAAASIQDLQLILCGGDRCERHTFRVEKTGDLYDVALLDEVPDESPSTVPELDPPPGALRGWLDRVLPLHAFVVLVFYRGYW